MYLLLKHTKMENILDEIQKHKNIIKELNEKIKVSSNINENNNIN